MQRREFITLLSGVATAWPFTARAQQPERMRRIGVLLPGTSDDAEYEARQSAFLQALQQLGWTDGRNVLIDTRWAAGDPNLIRKHAAELIALAPDVILTAGSATMGPLLQATRAVPIVFTTVPDPVDAGFVDSLVRPGGNATGFIAFEYGLSAKWLGLLKQIEPSLTRVAILRAEDSHRARRAVRARNADPSRRSNRMRQWGHFRFCLPSTPGLAVMRNFIPSCDRIRPRLRGAHEEAGTYNAS